ncbi:MAG: SRPBCC domain-containing protein [Methanolobus sp.]|nr:SRPBCC domain-containing protein [Methanolobus sp.]
MPETDFAVNKEKLEVVIKHIFDAPRELVWKTITDPNSIPDWWGPGNMTTVVDKMDVKKGGAWRYVHKDEQDNEYGFNGVYKEVKEPEVLSDTFNYEPIGPGHELTETMELEELEGGKTKATSVSRYNTLEDLEGMVQSGMKEGVIETYDRLDELLEDVRSKGRT